MKQGYRIPKRSANGQAHAAELSKWYKKQYDDSDKLCEECTLIAQGHGVINERILEPYDCTYVSHILSRGAFPELALHPKNKNILCPQHHREWETGDYEKMKIYPGNLLVIDELQQFIVNKKTEGVFVRSKK